MPGSLRPVLLASALSVSLTMLSGCVSHPLTPPESAAIANHAASPPAVCGVWLPFTANVFDARDTRKQAKANNAARRGYGCPDDQ